MAYCDSCIYHTLLKVNTIMSYDTRCKTWANTLQADTPRTAAYSFYRIPYQV